MNERIKKAYASAPKTWVWQLLAAFVVACLLAWSGTAVKVSNPTGNGLEVAGNILSGIFHCRPLQRLFSTLHPWLAFRLGNTWSKHNRLRHKTEYVFRGEDEPLYKFAEELGEKQHIDYFIFGHFHSWVDLKLPCGANFRMVKDWFRSSPYLVWDGESLQSAEYRAR